MAATALGTSIAKSFGTGRRNRRYGHTVKRSNTRTDVPWVGFWSQVTRQRLLARRRIRAVAENALVTDFGIGSKGRSCAHGTKRMDNGVGSLLKIIARNFVDVINIAVFNQPWGLRENL